MNKYTIRTSETNSVRSGITKQNVDINLSQTTKRLPFPNVSTTLSQRNVYEEERQSGNNFRLILTIVPYCSNVLFNPLTEIIKGEGCANPIVITDCTNVANAPINHSNHIEEAYGEQNPTRTHMISNTEYSSDLHGGYEYHPGYDFFDNHILRNKSFKLVNKWSDETKSKSRPVFNTLGDYMRRAASGEFVKHSKRLSIFSLNGQSFNVDKHLYLIGDILRIDDSINNNLYEENGWWGFLNNTTIDAKELLTGKGIWETMDISRVINNRKSCEFIDMYPDRTLFSFNPKYNKYRHTEERNWNVVITYPYKNIYSHPICYGGTSYIKRSMDSNGDYAEEAISEGGVWTGLKVMNAELGSGKIGSNTVVFRTFTKHGLKQNDTFYLYYTNIYKNRDDKNKIDNDETYYESTNYFKVSNVGDMSRKNDDYYFYTTNLGLIEELYNSYLEYNKNRIEKDSFYNNDDHKGIYDRDNVLKSDLINHILSLTNFRIRRCVRGVKSTYYLRLFRKIPNLRGAKRKMTDEEKLHSSKFNGIFDDYVRENGMDPENDKYQRLINNEQYQMGFASNIYNDNTTQITFMDGINTEGLTDNLGRPLSEIYYTVVKNNAGHEAWYMEDKSVSKKPIYSNENLEPSFKEKYGNDYTIEFSHCFGKVTSGLDMFFKKDDSDDITGGAEFLKRLSSAHHITNVVNDCENGVTNSVKKDNYSNNLDDDLKYKDTFFYGDLSEFNPIDFEERTLSNVMHRFNTAQRELVNSELYCQYQYHEIAEDDYDKYPFEVQEFSAVGGYQKEWEDKGKQYNDRIKDWATIARPEGYIYQAHYPIKIREYTRILQSSHRTIGINSVKPVQQNGILIQVKTTLQHRLNANDIIFICDDESDTRYITRCVKSIDSTTFLMSPDYTEIVYNATNFVNIETEKNIDTNRSNKSLYKKRYSWLELCDILNGNKSGDLTYPRLVLRAKNSNIPDYATYIGGNQYLWRDIVNIGDSQTQNLPDYIFANGYFYVTQSINFYLKRQDPYGNNGLYFDGEKKYPVFPNDPSGNIQKENNFVSKDTEVVC